MGDLISKKTIERLILYRRILLSMDFESTEHIYSHNLANLANVTAAQVRRDLMVIGYSGTSIRGYEPKALLLALSEFLDTAQTTGVALVGLGDIGRAILHYFKGRRPKLEIQALFDIDPVKINKVYLGCRAYPIDEIPSIILEKRITVGIIAVPAFAAQDIANRLIGVGIRGILNYAPAQLDVPRGIVLENRDMMMAVEKVAYFTRQSTVKG
jgi:redox-sensing transcriptional repressor